MAIKRLIWLYFWLLLFEGALRKWIVPSLDTVLLLVRDPVVILIYLFALHRGLFPRNALIRVGFFLAIMTGIISLTLVKPQVALYGMRVNMLHVPLIFVIGRVFDRNDVLKIGRWVLLLAMPMSLLIVQQFLSPPDAWINKGAFETHYGSIRPSGTFSFVTGNAAYLALVTAFLTYGYVAKVRYPLWLKIGATAALLVSLAVSGSRLAVASVVITAGMAIVTVVLRGKGFVGIISAAIALVIVMAALGQTTVFKKGTDQLTRRFEDASPDKDSMTSFATERTAGDTLLAFKIAGEAPLLGNGTGLGTSLGAFLATGDRTFLGAEGELGRLVWESGPVLGLALVFYRFWLGFSFLPPAWRLFRRGEILPLLLLAACEYLIILGQWGMTNIQGFACLVAGFALAAARLPKKQTAPRPILKPRRYDRFAPPVKRPLNGASLPTATTSSISNADSLRLQPTNMRR
ncbi:MAG TPA: hypothetical protein VIT91_07840 [Chthoniobacterales bacterium]